MEIGVVAQLGERCVRNAEVEGSTPFGSIGQRRIESRQEKVESRAIGPRRASRDKDFEDTPLSIGWSELIRKGV